ARHPGAHRGRAAGRVTGSLRSAQARPVDKAAPGGSAGVGQGGDGRGRRVRLYFGTRTPGPGGVEAAGPGVALQANETTLEMAAYNESVPIWSNCVGRKHKE